MTARFEEAEAAIARRDFVHGLRLGEALTRLHPQSARAFHLVALCERRLARHEAARIHYAQALALDPENAAIHANFANLLDELGEPIEAARHYEQALALEPDFVDALINYGLLNQQNGKPGKARALLEKAVGLAPEEVRGWHGRALAERAAGDLKNAAAAVERAVALRPGDPTLLHLRALIATERGQPASHLFRAARAKTPQSAELALDEAIALYEEGHWREGFAAVAALSDAHPAWIQAHAALAKLTWEEGRTGDFARGFEVAAAKLPDEPSIRTAHIAVLMKAGRYREAIERIDRARRQFGEAQWFDESEAACASELGDIARADRLFAHLDCMMDVGAATAYMRHLLRAGRPERASERGTEVVSLPGGTGAWPYLATAWRMLGDPRWDWLEGDPRLISMVDLPLTDTACGALTALLVDLHRARHHPFDQTLRGGTQTAGAILDRTEQEIAVLRAMLADAIADHIAGLPPFDADHPVLGVSRDAFRFSGSWSSLLTAGGRHTNHVHPNGWLSSALYLDLPAAIGADLSRPDGWLTFGLPPEEMGIALAPIRLVEPRPGRLVLFPSVMWHGTLPFAAGRRLTIAFDVAPMT